MAISLAAAGPAAATPPLVGNFGGIQARLVLTDTGGSFETGCAAGTLTAPVRVDSHGRFAVSGRFEAYQGGPQPGDATAPGTPARFSGIVEGNALTLTIEPRGGEAQVFRFERDRRSKIIRCA